jgi:hypothetical protein
MNNINTDEFSNETIEIPIEHQQIVLERMEKSKTDPERLLDWDEVSKDI